MSREKRPVDPDNLKHQHMRAQGHHLAIRRFAEQLMSA
jgi:hypothetical protein